MAMKLIFGLMFFTCSLCYAESSLLDVCSPEVVDSQGVYECSKKKSKEADLELNNAYRELNDKVSVDYKADPLLGDELKSHIKKSQRAWIVLRDENCAIESFVTPSGTQAFETSMNYCIARESILRVRYLRGLKF
ncbi:lysozyme inhibitor LprI family protein [Pseudomonas fluorescens]|uniref:Lysozyme inhibitor LprI-like N-terminal domain-containing protein n=1 Tax=Pseudomonas fluorescens TaxID=294 RepID=A0A5E7F7U0_PSEFL|nr:lysozyme inhibitor LprI family protein [Pseudomonas fluorescens]VVO35548.1 hypothetical protein PS723_05340 [Pseudomonas fluorescens]